MSQVEAPAKGKTGQAMDLLRADPTATNAAVAAAVGCDEGLVRKARLKLRALEPPAAEPDVEEVPICRLRLDLDTQMRPALDPETLDRYVDVLDELAPIKVMDTPEGLVVYDGFHTVEAARRSNEESVRAVVRPGTVREARWEALAANKAHGLNRSHETIARAINAALDDPEWGSLTTEALRRHLGVSWGTVDRHRRLRESSEPLESDNPEPEPEPEPAARTTVNGHAVEVEPEDIAAARRNGTIPAGVAVEVTEPGPAPPDDRTHNCEPNGPPAAAEMTDAEWLESLPARAVLAGDLRKTFDEDALFYKRLAEPAREFKRQCVGPLRHLRRQGQYAYWIKRFLRIEPPEKWLVCGECSGTAQLPLMRGICEKCHGRGYRIP